MRWPIQIRAGMTRPATTTFWGDLGLWFVQTNGADHD